MDTCRQKLEGLKKEKDAEIDEFMEEHAENKFKANQDVKKKFKLKIAFATKEKDAQKLAELEAEQKAELKKVEK